MSSSALLLKVISDWKRFALIGFLVLSGLSFGQKQSKSESEPQSLKLKLAEVYVDNAKDPTYIQVDGVWEPDNPTKQNELTFTVVNIKCYRSGGKEFVGTEPFCLVATATPIVGTIHVSADWMKVVEWNKTEILIVDESPECIISQTTVDLTSNTVVGLDIRKPNAKGLLASCKLLPDRQTYYLRDKIDYSLNHEPVKK